MKFPLARRLQGSNAGAKGDVVSKSLGGSPPPPAPETSVGATPVPAPPADDLVASGFDDKTTANEYGRIEAFDGRYLSGWYFDLINKSHSLTIMFDDKVLCGTLANLSRMDVVGANPHSPDRCGFFVDLGQPANISPCNALADL